MKFHEKNDFLGILGKKDKITTIKKMLSEVILRSNYVFFRKNTMGVNSWQNLTCEQTSRPSLIPKILKIFDFFYVFCNGCPCTHVHLCILHNKIGKTNKQHGCNVKVAMSSHYNKNNDRLMLIKY